MIGLISGHGGNGGEVKNGIGRERDTLKATIGKRDDYR